QRQADEVGDLELALMLPQAAEIEIWLHGPIKPDFADARQIGSMRGKGLEVRDGLVDVILAQIAPRRLLQAFQAPALENGKLRIGEEPRQVLVQDRNRGR